MNTYLPTKHNYAIVDAVNQIPQMKNTAAKATWVYQSIILVIKFK